MDATQPNTAWTPNLPMGSESLWDAERQVYTLLGRGASPTAGLVRFAAGRSVRVDGPTVRVREVCGWTVSGWPVLLFEPHSVEAELPAVRAGDQLDVCLETITGPRDSPLADTDDPPERLRLVVRSARPDVHRPAVGSNQLDLGRFAQRLDGWVHAHLPRLHSFDAIAPRPACWAGHVAPFTAALVRLAERLNGDTTAGWRRGAMGGLAAELLVRWHRLPVDELVARIGELVRLRRGQPAWDAEPPAPSAAWADVEPAGLPAYLADLLEEAIAPDRQDAYELQPGTDVAATPAPTGTRLVFLHPQPHGRLELRFALNTRTQQAAVQGPNVASALTPGGTLFAVRSLPFSPLVGQPYLVTPVLPACTHWWIPTQPQEAPR